MFDVKSIGNRKAFSLLLLTLAALIVTIPAALAQIPPGYYDSADDKTGSALRNALHEIIDDHTVIPHSSSGYDTQAALEDLDEDPADPGNVILIYSGYSVPKSSWPDWNREHTWPKSYGTEDGPANTDMFHIFACDANVNSSRGNKYYDNGGTSYHPEAPECFYDFDSWEVRDVEKGDLARVMFYLDVRYNGDQTDELDLELTDNISLIQSGSRYMGKLSTLLEWHMNDPVDDVERARNDFIHQNIQYNRNPFIDHPDWVYSIWGGPLSADTWRIYESTASTVDFELDAGAANAYRSYFLLGSASGTEPGVSLPGGMTTLPLNYDFFLAYIRSHANSSILVDFRGSLDGSGQASAQFNTLGPLPPGIFPVGTQIHFAYTLLSPFDYVSNAVAVEVEP